GRATVCAGPRCVATGERGAGAGPGSGVRRARRRAAAAGAGRPVARPARAPRLARLAAVSERSSLAVPRALGPFLAPYRGRVALAGAALVIAAGAALAMPLAFRQLIDLGFSSAAAA